MTTADVQNPRRILVLPNFGLGDLIQISAALEMAGRNVPGLELSCAVYSDEHRALLQGHPYIHNLVDYGSSLITKGAANKLRIMQQNREALSRADEVISVLSPSQLGPETLTPLGGLETRFHVLSPPDMQTKLFYHYQKEFAAYFGLEVSQELFCPARIALDMDEAAAAAGILEQAGLGQGFLVVLAMDAGTRHKSIPAETALMLAGLFRDAGCEVLIPQGVKFPGLTRRAAGQLGDKVSLIGFEGVRKYLGALSLANLVVTCDSGTSHMAAALGIPVISLFGPTPILFTPGGGRVCVVEKSVACRIKQANKFCNACTHQDHVNDGRHSAACMYWFKPGDIIKALEMLGLADYLPRQLHV
jgi:ADP-heptose:LPS heptosyltransferase